MYIYVMMVRVSNQVKVNQCTIYLTKLTQYEWIVIYYSIYFEIDISERIYKKRMPGGTMIYPPRNTVVELVELATVSGNSTIDKEKEKKVPGMIG